MASPAIALPAHLFRWLLAPAAIGVLSVLGALLAAVGTLVRQRTRPAMPRMSDEWLQGLDRDSGRQLDHWR